MIKRYIFFLFVFATSLNAIAQRIVAEKEIYDFGNIIYSVPVVAKFDLSNRGNDLIIERVSPSCGCMIVDYPTSTIPKGDKFSILVTYDAQQMGHFEKDIAIYSNALEMPFYLKIRGVVIAEAKDFSGSYNYTLSGLRVDKNYIEFSDVSSGGQAEAKLYILNDTGEEVTPKFLRLPSYVTVEITPETIAPSHTAEATFTLNAEKLHSYGLTQSSIYLVRNSTDKVSPEKEITLSSVLIPNQKNLSETQKINAPRIKLSTDTLDLGTYDDKSLKQGTIMIENTGRSPLVISSMQMFTRGLKVSLQKSKIPSGGSAKLKITADKKVLRQVKGTPRVLMITNDPDNPKVTVNVLVRE